MLFVLFCLNMTSGPQLNEYYCIHRFDFFIYNILCIPGDYLTTAFSANVDVNINKEINSIVLVNLHASGWFQ